MENSRYWCLTTSKQRVDGGELESEVEKICSVEIVMKTVGGGLGTAHIAFSSVSLQLPLESVSTMASAPSSCKVKPNRVAQCPAAKKGDSTRVEETGLSAPRRYTRLPSTDRMGLRCDENVHGGSVR